MIVQENQVVDTGQHLAMTSNLFVNTDKETLFINFQNIGEEQVPACSFKFSHPTGAAMMWETLGKLGYKVGEVIPDDVVVPLARQCEISVTKNGSYKNSSIDSVSG